MSCLQVWHMSLDNTRNRTLQLNLAISVASFALMASTVPASLFGMNLHSGLEVRCCIQLFLNDFALMASTVPASLFSTGLHSGLEVRCAFSCFYLKFALLASSVPVSLFGMDLRPGLEVCRGQSLQFALCDALTNVSLFGTNLHSDLIFSPWKYPCACNFVL